MCHVHTDSATACLAGLFLKIWFGLRECHSRWLGNIRSTWSRYLHLCSGQTGLPMPAHECLSAHECLLISLCPTLRAPVGWNGGGRQTGGDRHQQTPTGGHFQAKTPEWLLRQGSLSPLCSVASCFAVPYNYCFFLKTTTDELVLSICRSVDLFRGK